MTLWRKLPLLALCLWSAQGLTWTVPGVANADGTVTRVAVTNKGRSAASVTFNFLPVDASVIVLPETRQVDAGQTLILDDALANLWSLNGQSGTLSIDGDQPLNIHGRRLTGDGSRSLGTRLPLISETSVLQKGQSGFLLWAAQTGDDATGSRTNLLLTLLDPGTQVIAVLHDANGAKLGTQYVNGDAGAYILPVPLFTDADVPQARFSVIVASGRAVAALETHDQASGDLAISEATSSQELTTGNLINDDVHTTASDSQTLVTDLRLANVGSGTLTFPLSSGGGTRVITLPPGGMLEILDHLEVYLGAHPDRSGSFSTFVSAGVGRPDLVMQARLRVVNNDGSPGALTEIHRSQPPTASFEAGQTAIVDGLPPIGGRVFLVLRSMAARTPAVVQVQGFKAGSGATGDPVEIALASNEVRFAELAGIPGLSDLTEGDSIAVTVTAGNADVRAFLSRPGSNDPEVWTASPALTDADLDNFNACTAPDLTSLTVNTLTLPEPGKILINWRSANATSVDLAPWATGLPPAGSYEADVAATTDGTVTVRNSCDQQDTPLRITVGSPVLTSAVAPAAGGASEGAPGQLIRLALDNIADPAQVTDVLFQADDNSIYPAPILGQAPDGLFEARVPLIMYNADPKGYRTGTMKLSVLVSGKGTAPTDFTIQPLVYSGDPAAGFVQMLDKLDAAVQPAMTQLEGISDTAPAVADQRAAYSALTGRLRALASSIAANGKGTLPVDISATPGPDTVTLTTADLGVLMAYNDNLRPVAADDGASAMMRTGTQQPAVSRESSSQSFAPKTPLAGGSCLANKVPLVPVCKALEKAQRLDAQITEFIDSWSNYFDLGPIGDWAVLKAEEQAKKAQEWLKSAPKEGRLGIWGKTMYYTMLVARAQCYIYPIRVNGFTVNPKDVVWVPERYDSPPSTLQISVQMGPEKKTAGIVDDLLSKEANALQSKLKKKGYPDALSGQLARALAEGERSTVTAFVENFKKMQNIKESDEQTVGYCDLVEVWGKKNGKATNGQEKYIRGRSVIERSKTRVQGQDPFYYLGRLPRAKDTLCVYPRFDNFVFHSIVEQHRGLYWKSDCRYTTGGASVVQSARAGTAADNPTSEAEPEIDFADELNTGRGPRRFLVYGAQSDTFENYGGPEQRVNWFLPNGQEVTTAKPFTGPSTSVGVSSSSVNGKQTEDSDSSASWEMNLFATGSGSTSQENPPWEDRTSIGFSATAENNPQLGLSPRATIEITQNGNCGTFVYSVVIFTPDGTSVVLATGPKSVMPDFRADVEATRVNIGVGAEAYDLFDNGPTSTCRPKVKVRLYDAETDNSDPVPARLPRPNR
jgi:hypothetical protein